MNWIILVGAVMLVSFVAAWLIGKYTYSDATAPAAAVGIIAAFTLLILSLSLIDKRSDFRAIKAEYDTTKALVETYAGAEYGNMNELTGQVIKINNKIAKHKAYAPSKWTGIWYSEEIGALEPITFSNKK